MRACVEAMPSPYSRFAHTPNERTLLRRAGAVLMATAVLDDSVPDMEEAEQEDADACAETLFFGAAIAAASEEPNRYNIHTGSYKLRDWRDWEEDKFEATFRFDKADVGRLAAALQLPATIRTRERNVFTRDQAITVLLLRFNNLPLLNIFKETGLRPSRASSILSWLYDFLWDKWYVRLLASDLKRWTPYFEEWSSAASSPA